MENQRLTNEIIQRIRAEGKITFADFMALALYHPIDGYYCAGFEKFGKAGDYYTSSNVHAACGQLIAKQIIAMWKRLGKPRDFAVVEMGAGSGLLCLDILNFLQISAPDFFVHFHYLIIEPSDYHQRRQQTALYNYAEMRKVSWSDWANLTGRKIIGCFFSNELIDALPVHLLIKSAGKLKEIYVVYEGQEFKEIVDDLSSPSLADYFTKINVDLSEGQRAEANLRALDLFRKIGQILEKGFVLTIDYGFLADELYDRSRRNGTLLCYYRHTVNENPFQNIGYQDITSHVNFSALMELGAEIGLETSGFTTQQNFLLALGLADLLEQMEHTEHDLFLLHKNKLLLKNLILPGGMGETFKVLIQHKGIKDPQLTGLREF